MNNNVWKELLNLKIELQDEEFKCSSHKKEYIKYQFLFNPLCRVFPFDEKDKELINKDCGYYWDEK